MTTSRLIRQILLGASKGGLEIAVAAVSGPVALLVPLLRGALTPVLDRLAEQLGEDPVGSPEAAQRAADAVEMDPRLEELLRSGLALRPELAEILKSLLAGQQRYDAHMQQLFQVMMEGSQALQDLERKVGSIDAQLSTGVTSSDDIVERLVEMIEKRAAVVREVHGFARDEMKAAGVEAELHGAWVTRDELIAEINHAEVDAVRKIEEGQGAEATSGLHDARGKLAQALVETPSDVSLRVLDGYLLKAIAQAYASSGRQDAAISCLQRAETIFGLILRDPPTDADTRSDIASALNGLANTLAERGRHAEAVPLYQKAIQMEPGYGYAWHDLFLSLSALAAEGDLRSDDLDEAWEGLLTSAPGQPGLESSHLEILRADYELWRHSQ